MYSDKILKMSIGALVLALSASSSHALDFKVKYDSSLSGVSEDFKSVLEESLVTVGSYIHAPYSLYLNIKAGDTKGSVATGETDHNFVLTNSIVNFRALAGEITVDEDQLAILKNGTFDKSGLAVTIKHELLHVLGVTNHVDSFSQKSMVDGNKVEFTGRNVKAVSGGEKRYLNKWTKDGKEDLSHFINNPKRNKKPDFPTAIAPSGGTFSTFDLAVLADIGYPINRTEEQKTTISALPGKDYSDNALANQSYMGKRPSAVEVVENWKEKKPVCEDLVAKFATVSQSEQDKKKASKANPPFFITGMLSKFSKNENNKKYANGFLINALSSSCPFGSQPILWGSTEPSGVSIGAGKSISSKITYADRYTRCQCVTDKKKIAYLKIVDSSKAIYRKPANVAPSLASGSTKIKNGDLVRADTSPRVYLVVEGERRWIPDQRRFFHMGYGFSDVAVLKEAEVKKVPEGLPLSYNGLQSGDFIRIKEENVTYVFSGGSLHKLADMHVFWSSWPNDNYLMDLTQDDITGVPVSGLVIGPVERP